MEDKLINETYNLLDLIKASDDYKETLRLENIMSEDKDFLMLSNLYKQTQDEYNELAKLKVDLTNITKRLSEVNEKLYSLDVVKAYYQQFKKMQENLEEISKKITEGVLYESSRR